MNKEDYLYSIDVCGTKVDIGSDDYGQCYYCEFDYNGEHREFGLGTYNFNYLDEIFYTLDPDFKELLRKELFGELSEYDAARLQGYYDTFKEIYKKEKESKK